MVHSGPGPAFREDTLKKRYVNNASTCMCLPAEHTRSVEQVGVSLPGPRTIRWCLCLTVTGARWGSCISVESHTDNFCIRPIHNLILRICGRVFIYEDIHNPNSFVYTCGAGYDVRVIRQI
jgi:hypothetical protein